MHVAFIGISHWHAPLYYKPCALIPGVSIVGVSDPHEEALRRRVAAELGARDYADFRDMVRKEKPDYVFAFARHSEMAEMARWLIDAGVPSLLEKPTGLNHAEVSVLRDSAAAKGVHAGTGFNFRVSDFVRSMQALAKDDPVTAGSFHFIAGSPQRYRDNASAWMLDPALSGGGSTLNLSIHFFDMFRLFTCTEPSEVTAMMGSNTWGLPIEDFSSVILRSPKAVVTVETGYTFAGPHMISDLHFALRNRKNYVVVRDSNVIETYQANGEISRTPTLSSTNAPWYPLFVQESLERFAAGRHPVADLDDLAAAIRIADAAYESHRAGKTTRLD